MGNTGRSSRSGAGRIRIFQILLRIRRRSKERRIELCRLQRSAVQDLRGQTDTVGNPLPHGRLDPILRIRVLGGQRTHRQGTDAAGRQDGRTALQGILRSTAVERLHQVRSRQHNIHEENSSDANGKPAAAG